MGNVFSFCESPLQGSRKRKKNQTISLFSCPRLHNLPFTFYIFIFEPEKRRAKTISNRCPHAICTVHEFS